jgi:hypothetical protein
METLQMHAKIDREFEASTIAFATAGAFWLHDPGVPAISTSWIRWPGVSELTHVRLPKTTSKSTGPGPHLQPI